MSCSDIWFAVLLSGLLILFIYRGGLVKVSGSSQDASSFVMVIFKTSLTRVCMFVRCSPLRCCYVGSSLLCGIAERHCLIMDPRRDTHRAREKRVSQSEGVVPRLLPLCVRGILGFCPNKTVNSHNIITVSQIWEVPFLAKLGMFIGIWRRRATWVLMSTTI